MTRRGFHRLGTLILAGWLAIASAPTRAQDDAIAEGLDLELAPAEAPVTTVRLEPYAARLHGWTPQTLGQLSFVLFEAPSHGLPDQEALALRLQDEGLPLSERSALASLAALRYFGWLEHGLVDADSLAPRGLLPAEAESLTRLLQDALDRDDLTAAHDAVLPNVRDYDILRTELLRALAVRPIWPVIEAGRSLSPGDQGQRVDQLRARLAAEGLLDSHWQEGAPYDVRLETAVRRFQGRANLSPTGRLDQPTLRQLNIAPDRRIAQLRANLEQRRWRTRRLGYRHIWVNLADFRLEAWEDGRLEREHQVMIGGQASSTPEFSEDMQYIVLNPWWGLPAGSARPRFQSMRRNPGIVREHGFRIFNSAGEAISVYEIDWSRWGNNWPYRMSQPPGPTNPMGEVKFIFPNRHNVYIHDTIERDRFVRTRRDFSAGCIRVQDPLALAEWVLVGQDDWDRERIEAVVSGSDPTVVWLDRRIPVHIAYWTVVGDASGRVRYLHDLYQRDGRLISAYDAAFDRLSGSIPEPLASASGPSAAVRP